MTMITALMPAGGWKVRVIIMAPVPMPRLIAETKGSYPNKVASVSVTTLQTKCPPTILRPEVRGLPGAPKAITMDVVKGSAAMLVWVNSQIPHITTMALDAQETVKINDRNRPISLRTDGIRQKRRLVKLWANC